MSLKEASPSGPSNATPSFTELASPVIGAYGLLLDELVSLGIVDGDIAVVSLGGALLVSLLELPVPPPLLLQAARVRTPATASDPIFVPREMRKTVSFRSLAHRYPGCAVPIYARPAEPTPAAGQ
jgi:hypothetical protein